MFLAFYAFSVLLPCKSLEMSTLIKAPELYDILFLDIETVSQYEHLEEAPALYQSLWERKAALFTTPPDSASSLYDRSAIYAEFGRVVCISLGYFHRKTDVGETLRVSAFVGDEKSVLKEFCNALEAFSALHERVYLCAHNGKEFDFPYIARRLLIHKMSLPLVLQVAGRKPWETGFLDTLDLWKFGDYKHYTSLELLSYTLGVSELMDGMDGSKVHQTYYDEKDLLKIATYCQHDTATCAQVYRRMRDKEIIAKENIIYADPLILDADEEDLTVSTALSV